MYIECFGVFHCLLWHWCFWRVQTSYFAEYTSIWVGLMSPRASQLGKNLPANARRHKRPGFDPWVGKIWRRPWQPTPVFWPGESHGQRSLVGYSPVHGVAKSQTWLKLLSMHACMSPHDWVQVTHAWQEHHSNEVVFCLLQDLREAHHGTMSCGWLY